MQNFKNSMHFPLLIIPAGFILFIGLIRRKVINFVMRTFFGKWKDYLTIMPMTLIEGDRNNSHLMRRWGRGKWEYRLATEDEDERYRDFLKRKFPTESTRRLPH